MPVRKRASADVGRETEPMLKRRSSRQAQAAAAVPAPSPPAVTKPVSTGGRSQKKSTAASSASKAVKQSQSKSKAKKEEELYEVEESPKQVEKTATKSKAAPAKKDARSESKPATSTNGRDATSPDPDPASIPTRNPDTPRHEGKWYWLLKAEPETRIENGIDVRFSIDDLRSRTKPEGWDGIRSYAARNNLRAMNAGDMAFFYHSNCKTPGIVGTMEIVKEASEDKSARRPGTPYYDPQSTRDKPRWSLVHVEFRSKFAVPIFLPELRDMGKASGSPLEGMQLLKQSRLSVSRVSAEEWEALCELADEKAKEAGLEHEE